MIDTKALRSRILDLAIQGKLTEQLESDGTAEELYHQIQEEKQKFVKEGKIKKEKLLPEIKEDELPFEIPSNWKWARIGQICLQVTDGTHRTPNYQKDGIPFLSVKNISSGYLDFTDIKYISEEEHHELIKRCKPEKNDILICRIGTLGKAIVIDSDIEFSIFVSLGLLKIRSKQLSDYIVDTINSGYGSKWIIEHKAGGAMHADKINLTDLNLMTIPLPPLAEQKRIVQRVEEIFSVLDTIDEAQKKYSADVKILKAKLITAGIQGKLTQQLESDGTAEELYQHIRAEKQQLIKDGKIKKEKPLPPIKDEEIPFEVPSSWKWCRLNEISEKITSGSTPPGGKKGNAYVKQGYCFFREQNIYNDGIHMNGMVYIAEELLNTRKNSTVIANDILLNITGGSIGRCAIIPDDFTKGSINQHILIIRLVNEDMRYFIHQILCSPYVQKLIKNKAVGDKDGFSGGRCKAMLVPLPPLAEQKRIAEKFGELLGALE